MNGLVCTVILEVVLLFSSLCLAGEYTPPSLYEVDYYQLPNGLNVLLKERHQARTISYRVVINTGMADYPCGRKETPHFLEHLLFTGTSRHTESELDDLIEEHGGVWNAGTYNEKTVYELDIFSKYYDLGLETIYEIISDSQISQENVNKSRDIIHRESGGRPSAIKRWFYKNGIGKTGVNLAYDILLAGTPYVCENIEMADDIKRSDILDAYQRYYVSNNTTLIVVGDFKPAEIKAQINATFGVMKTGQAYSRQVTPPKQNNEELLLTSTLTPVFDNEAIVGVAYAAAGSQSPDYQAMWFIDRYLQDRLYKKIRIDEGKSYAPSTFYSEYSDIGVFIAIADTELSDIDEVVDMIQHEFDQLVQTPLKKEQFLLIKNKLLMSIVQGYESNTDMSDYYMKAIVEIQRYGALVKVEEKIMALSINDIQRVAKKYFGIVPQLVFHNTPTMTYTQFGVVLGIIILVIGYFSVQHVRGLRSKNL